LHLEFTLIFTTNFVGSLDIRVSREVFPIGVRSPEIRVFRFYSDFLSAGFVLSVPSRIFNVHISAAAGQKNGQSDQKKKHNSSPQSAQRSPRKKILNILCELCVLAVKYCSQFHMGAIGKDTHAMKSNIKTIDNQTAQKRLNIISITFAFNTLAGSIAI
jgi:hypothetical protein